MFEFKTAPPSKALAYGTNMSCLDDRLYVCRLNKHFVINNDKNTVVLKVLMKNNKTNWDCRLKSFLSDTMSSKQLDIEAYGCYVRNRYASETNTDTSNCANACSGK